MNFTQAQESGFFIGLALTAQGISRESDIQTEIYSVNKTGTSGTLLFGYKYMFDFYQGLRFYANIDGNSLEFNRKNEILNEFFYYRESESGISNYSIYGLNFDYIYQHIFIGLNLGRIEWDKELTETLEKAGSTFYAALNLGLTSNNPHHNFELFGKIPFTETKVNYTSGGSMILKQNYSF